MDSLLERNGVSSMEQGYRAPLELLQAFCAERSGQVLSAKDRYAAIVDLWPRSQAGFEASLRLRELGRLQRRGKTPEELRQQAEQARETSLYGHQPRERQIPVYPPLARAAGVEGVATVDFAISRAGGVTDLVVIESEPPFVFDGVALAAMRGWLYSPSDSDDPRRATVRFPFVLDREAPMLVAERTDEAQLGPVEVRGRRIYESVVAAGRASHAAQRAGYLSSLWDWIVVPGEPGLLVRYLDDQGRAIVDVGVDVFSTALEQVAIHEQPVALPPEQYEIWKAREASKAFGKKSGLTGCTNFYSTAVFPAPEPERGWDVYVLSLSRDGRTVTVGGHYRIRVPSDPDAQPQIHAFANGCPEARSLPDSDRLVITDDGVEAPTEIHVFLNLRYERPLGIVVGGERGGLWFVDHGRIQRADESAGEQ
jgi:TonB family protein